MEGAGFLLLLAVGGTVDARGGSSPGGGLGGATGLRKVELKRPALSGCVTQRTNSRKKIVVCFLRLAFNMQSTGISDAIFTLISDQAYQLPQRCISLFEQGAVVCVSVKLQTTSGHIW